MRFRPMHLIAVAFVGAMPLPASAADNATPPPITSVVELFTSQGCSSCPPADALMKSYIKQDGVLALSFNVDYWDNLGWKDTLASPKYSQRQRAYARTRGDGQVYTPQAVINGAAHAVGSDRAGIDAKIKATDSKWKGLAVPLVAASRDDSIMIAAPSADLARAVSGEATLWLVKFTPRVEVAIARGENSGRTVAYHNVVREFTAVGHWTNTATTAKLSRAELSGCTPGTCAILLQQGGTGAILGAVWVPGMSGI